MTTLREAAQQALEAWDGGDTEWFKRAYTVMEALRAALAEPEPQRKPLSDDEIAQAMYRADAIFTGPMQFRFAREIERAHGIKP